jgi:hypothetical protein
MVSASWNRCRKRPARVSAANAWREFVATSGLKLDQ